MPNIILLYVILLNGILLYVVGYYGIAFYAKIIKEFYNIGSWKSKMS